MSLLTDAMEEFVFLNKTKEEDGYGGYRNAWAEGVTFQAAAVFDNSIEARTAQKQGVTSLYTITTSKAMTLEYHDVIRRSRDQKIFRITSDGDDKFTPISASLDMRQVTAEDWSIADE